jgi:hypothetical protein
MTDGNAWRCLLLGLYCDYGWKRFDGAGCQITHSVVAPPTSEERVAPISSYRFEHCSVKERTTWACQVSHYSMHVVWICVSLWLRWLDYQVVACKQLRRSSKLPHCLLLGGSVARCSRCMARLRVVRYPKRHASIIQFVGRWTVKEQRREQRMGRRHGRRELMGRR